ncbi:STAS domain-containing protein [Methylobacterium pseudosasicola]|uniref:RsbT co-antagonist protein RsbR n=1 Tax=Methylobacterium pseudosasicola TaxID=582667 RepID=A0A1I4LAC0_9HYPH|nr:STAS domain-containing protein [Methylobacterium pseudosasicola]SFL87743.1 rsbT co-antagonist protein RsbR [Methylobacterium pseudosasicola]
MHGLGQILLQSRADVLEAWLERLRETVPGVQPASLQLLKLELGTLIEKLTGYFLTDDDDGAGPAFKSVEEQAATTSAACARDGLTPMETATLILSLKAIAGELLDRETSAKATDLYRMRTALDAVVDRLALVTFAAFVETREEIIKRQGRALLDLATPALPIWRHIILMPLVGIIDTQRARQVMEWLLEALSREEARIAILDVTGVPLIDSRVALHLTKTVEAARLLGSQVIVTGISPDAAQTLVKLDVDLSNMITRGSLRSGLAEAFRLLGQQSKGTTETMI